MEDLFFTATATTPYVDFKKTGILELSGKVISSEDSEFWTIIFNWVEEYAKNPSPSTMVKIQLDYLNSSSLLEINKFVKLIGGIDSPNSEVKILWLYNEVDLYMYEIGCELSNRNNIFFEMELIPEFV
jgi:hypothetical protein